MSFATDNRITALERQVKELLERVAKLEAQACEARPHTLTLKPKANTSHA